MANSDNVVRLGLTRKFIDLPVWKELLPENPTGRPVLNVPGPREDHAFETPAEEFRISRYELETGMRMRIMTGNSLEILLLISGRLVLRPEAAGSASPGCTIDRGQAWLIPGALPACTVEPLEPCLLFRVRVPQNGR